MTKPKSTVNQRADSTTSAPSVHLIQYLAQLFNGIGLVPPDWIDGTDSEVNLNRLFDPEARTRIVDRLERPPQGNALGRRAVCVPNHPGTGV
jgi:hypothetical protein